MNEPAIIYDFDPNNLPREHLEAIGLIIASASQTESILRDFIAGLLGIDEFEAVALGQHMTFPLKNDVIRALAELNAPSVSEVDEIDEMIDAIKDALDKRNAVAHNAFARHPETGEILSMRTQARGSLQVKLTPISVDQMRKDASVIYRAGMRLMEFMMSRNLLPKERTRVVHAPMKRGEKARAHRRNG